MSPEDKKQLSDLRVKLYSDERMSMEELAELIRLLELENHHKRQIRASQIPPSAN